MAEKLRRHPMSYSIVQPPFTLKFREMTKLELGAYADWFHRSAPARIAELTREVQRAREHRDWLPSTSPASLDVLDAWFPSHVETRPKSREELEETRSKLSFPIEIPDEQLTNRTFSLAMDIGMYFAQVVLANLPGTRWDQLFENRKFVDYGQPVIMGFGAVPLNPIRIVVMNAYGISRGQPSRIRGIHDWWARMRS